MARKKVSTPPISDLVGLKWTKQDNEEYRAAIDTCDFCKKDIYNTDQYWTAFSPIPGRNYEDDGREMAVAVACKGCGIAAGLEW